MLFPSFCRDIKCRCAGCSETRVRGMPISRTFLATSRGEVTFWAVRAQLPCSWLLEEEQARDRAIETGEHPSQEVVVCTWSIRVLLPPGHLESSYALTNPQSSLLHKRRVEVFIQKVSRITWLLYLFSMTTSTSDLCQLSSQQSGGRYSGRDWPGRTQWTGDGDHEKAGEWASAVQLEKAS